jgi:hypothetical protein
MMHTTTTTTTSQETINKNHYKIGTHFGGGRGAAGLAVVAGWMIDVHKRR